MTIAKVVIAGAGIGGLTAGLCLLQRGIDVEIVPGILPVANVAQLRRFAGMCGATIPPWIDSVLDGLDERPAARQLVAATIAAEDWMRAELEAARATDAVRAGRYRAFPSDLLPSA